MIRLAMIACLVLGLGAAEARAHPHVFIDSGLQMHFDDEGRLAAVRVVWVYDAFYSMLLLEELGLDPDFTGELTEAEKAQLSGFDMQWVEGFEGDLYALQEGKPLRLSGPRDWTADVQDGRIITTHVRAFEDRPGVAQDPLVIQVYDPTYYTAYRIVIDPQIEGRADCTARIFEPDRTAASEMLEAALAEMLAEPDFDEYEDFPAVGAAFSDEIRLTCAE
ncbi:DUF1007 family protein [Plastorhodobacter daqingensis]|uniref:DUF1007 family protein n=1 Tax=Plastorhodobacter daqingensis TaxID=1387281 RepID=A0ABW2UGU6_9RHOB